jgi:hypothetical protein
VRCVWVASVGHAVDPVAWHAAMVREENKANQLLVSAKPGVVIASSASRTAVLRLSSQVPDHLERGQRLIDEHGMLPDVRGQRHSGAALCSMCRPGIAGVAQSKREEPVRVRSGLGGLA